MEWRDEGAVLTTRPHGESAAVVEVLTAEHGRHAGIVRGAAGPRMAPVLQPGTQVAVVWRARLAEHLGSWSVEPVRSRSAQVLDDRAALAGLAAVTALASFALPEREPEAAFYDQTLTVLDLLGASDHWPWAYLLWERALLGRLGIGLDLGRCAVTGTTEGLAHVSPRSGRAVSAAGAGVWADRLLPLPPCLRGDGPPADLAELMAGLETTGWFLEQRLARALHRALPPARARLLAALARQG